MSFGFAPFLRQGRMIAETGGAERPEGQKADLSYIRRLRSEYRARSAIGASLVRAQTGVSVPLKKQDPAGRPSASPQDRPARRCAADELSEPDSMRRRTVRRTAASSSSLTWLLRNCSFTRNEP